MVKRVFKIEVEIPKLYDTSPMRMEIVRHLNASASDYIYIFCTQDKDEDEGD